MQSSFPAAMEAGSQLALRDQLFESVAVVLDTISRARSSEIADLYTLEGGLRSLQDTLLGSDYISAPELDPFYLLCLQLCDALNKQFTRDGSAFELASISGTGNGLGELREVLLVSFHALNTYLNIIRWYVRSVIFDGSTLRYQLVPPEKLMTKPNVDVWPASRVPCLTLRNIEHTSMASTNPCLLCCNCTSRLVAFRCYIRGSVTLESIDTNQSCVDASTKEVIGCHHG